MDEKEKKFFEPTQTQLDAHFSDQYDSIYRREKDANYFVGKLNGRSLVEFLTDMNEIEYFDQN